ncbi:MAG TPA: hypothetical protein VK524_04810, partial [Polyangiaceae bacterium]|nr:hypothetical protein [Polyangiaceae bacterium]
MGVTALFALPFALTESWFYPEYWRPHFLFDLADHLGFGVEDFLFVSALGAFTATVYPFAARKRFVARSALVSGPRWLRPLIVLVSALLIVLALRVLDVPTIFGACSAMLLVTAAMLVMRRDLIRASVAGGVLTLLVYAALCGVFQLLLPGV